MSARNDPESRGGRKHCLNVNYPPRKLPAIFVVAAARGARNQVNR